MRDLKLVLCLGLTGVILSACASDETLFAKGAGTREWALESINGKTVTAEASLTFGPRGDVMGRAPCNSFSAKQTAPYPWFEIKDLSVTKRHCDLALEETEFFEAFAAMNVSEVSGDLMILSNEVGQEMVFTAMPFAAE